jgi:hypothetical protein
MLSLACVFVRDGLPSIEMWFDRGENRCCGLSNVGMVETIGFRQAKWLVMLEYANDRILGVDTTGQHVSSRIRYEMACLLIRYAIGCVSFSIEWGWHHTLWSVYVILYELTEPHGVRGDVCVGNLSTVSGDRLLKNCSKAWHTPVVDLYNSM